MAFADARRDASDVSDDARSVFFDVDGHEFLLWVFDVQSSVQHDEVFLVVERDVRFAGLDEVAFDPPETPW